MVTVNLIMYREPHRTNFGDELSPLILKFLINKYQVNIEYILNKDSKINMCFIGSLIGWSNMNYNNLYILGGGIRTETDKIKKNKNMKVFSIRGPLSKKYLEKFDYYVPDIFGDPALLISRFYTPKNIKECKDKIGIVGHLTNFHKYKNISNKFILIKPTWLWNEVIDYITSCKLILSSSLHGLIVADAYNIPNIWLNEYPLNEGEFKFKDYFKSQNRELVSIDNINSYNKKKSYINGNTIELDKIEKAFVDMCSDIIDKS